jgi:HEAT repeat protein/beta-lactamase regulating signal transducer with metallopeptidase domain
MSSVFTFGSWLLPVALKGAVILAMTAMAALLLRRASAATKHLVWSLGIVGVFVVPVAAWAVPSLRLPIAIQTPRVWTVTSEASSPVSSVMPGEAASAESEDVYSESLPGSQVASPLRSMPHTPARNDSAWLTQVRSIHPGLSLTAVWLAGVVLMLTYFQRGLRNASWLVRRAETVEDERWHMHLERAAAQMGVRRNTLLLLSRDTAVPITCGLRQPIILLPADAVTWSDERARIVLLHELAHIHRRDCLIHYLAQVTRALHWFNPLAWLAVSRLTAERERACDDLVLATGTRGSNYAEHLLDIARGMRSRQPLVSALAMARPSELEGRLLAILDSARDHRPANRRRLAAGAVLSVVAVAAIGALRIESVVEARSLPSVFVDAPRQSERASAPTPTPTPTPNVIAMPTPTPTPSPRPHVRRHQTSNDDVNTAVPVVAPVVDVDVDVDDDDTATDERSSLEPAARDAVVRALVAALKDENDEVRQTAMASLMKLRSPLAFDPMVAALRDENPEIREQAAFALGQLRDEKAVPPLTAALKDENAGVREKVVFALGQLRAPSAVAPLAQALSDPQPSIRGQAAFALGRIRQPAAVQPLVGALKDQDADVRRQVIFALGRLRAPEAVPALIAALKDTDAEVRQQAAFALGQLRDQRAIDALTEALKDSDAEVRQQAAFALGHMAR